MDNLVYDGGIEKHDHDLHEQENACSLEEKDNYNFQNHGCYWHISLLRYLIVLQC